VSRRGKEGGLYTYRTEWRGSSIFGAEVTRRRNGILGKLPANSINRFMRADRPPEVTAPRRLAGSELTSQVPQPSAAPWRGADARDGIGGGNSLERAGWFDMS
jgi:hypothetical protein